MGKRLRFILSLALPYAVTIFLPVVAVLVLAGRVTADYREKIVEDRRESVESAFERFSRRMDNVVTLSYMIANNSQVTHYTYGSLVGGEHPVIDNIEMSTLLGDFRINSDVETFYLYDSGNNRVITPVSAYSAAEDYFRFAYRIEGRTGQEMKEGLNALCWGYEFAPSMQADIYGKSVEVFEYRLVLPFVRARQNQSYLVMVMSPENILSDLLDVLGEDGALYLYDEKGNLIYREGAEYRGGGIRDFERRTKAS